MCNFYYVFFHLWSKITLQEHKTIQPLTVPEGSTLIILQPAIGHDQSCFYPLPILTTYFHTQMISWKLQPSWIGTEQACVTVTLHTSIWEVPISNIGQDTGYPYWGSCGFPHSLQANTMLKPQKAFQILNYIPLIIIFPVHIPCGWNSVIK